MKITITQNILIDGQHTEAGTVVELDGEQAKSLVLMKRASFEVSALAAKKFEAAMAAAGKAALEAEAAAEADTLALIAAVTTVADLYAFQVEGRSQAVEEAINAKGTELVKAAEIEAGKHK